MTRVGVGEFYDAETGGVLRLELRSVDGRDFTLLRRFGYRSPDHAEPFVVPADLDTFTTDLARATVHLLDTGAPYGAYNLTSTGDPASWADLARAVFEATGHDPNRVTPVSTEQYMAGATCPVAPRPARSVLDLTKVQETGFEATDQLEGLTAYLQGRKDR